MGAGETLERVADTLGGADREGTLGKATVPDDSPYTTGGIGLLGTLPSEKAMEECDGLLLVGTSFPYMSYLPKPGRRKRCRSTGTPHGWGSAIRSTSGSAATPGRRWKRSCRC